jgi:V/A-type H+-transporting ATPase subunit E
MSEKLKALTDKIYSEGITKAKEESAKILAQAKEEASKILEEAKSEKIRIISEAENQAKTNKKKVEAEIKLASQKATNSIKQELRNILTEKIIEAPTKASLQNPDTLKEVIVACLSSLLNSSSKFSPIIRVTNAYIP